MITVHVGVSTLSKAAAQWIRGMRVSEPLMLDIQHCLRCQECQAEVARQINCRPEQVACLIFRRALCRSTLDGNSLSTAMALTNHAKTCENCGELYRRTHPAMIDSSTPCPKHFDHYLVATHVELKAGNHVKVAIYCPSGHSFEYDSQYDWIERY